MARLVEFRGALEREWAGTQTQVRHEDENPNPNAKGRLKKFIVGSLFYIFQAINQVKSLHFNPRRLRLCLNGEFDL